MSVVGFDLGNENCVVAVARQRGIDVVLNQESKRETPAVVSFGERQRLIGASASASAVMNPANSVTQIKRLLGRRFSDLKDELHLFPFKVEEGPDGLPRVHVRHLGEDRAFTPTQVLGMLLSSLKALAEKHLNSPVSDCCIGVPAFFTDVQRRAVLDAAAISGLRPLRLVHEATAAALEYGIYKTDLPEKDGEVLNVALVDVGHASTQACVVAYRKGKVRVLAHAFERSLGGRDLDEVLFRHFAGVFEKEAKVDIRSNPRACVRLRAACERLKKMLSANPEAPLNVECLVEDRDFRGFLRREELERIGAPIMERVKAPLEEAIRDAGIKVEDIHAVELVGSGSRVPAIVKILRNFFGKEPRRTMNASECVARGCALQCAMLSPAFRVRQFEVCDSYPFNVDVHWKVPSSATTKESAEAGKSSCAFSKGDPIPITKTLQPSNKSLSTIDLVYADASKLGVPEIISQYKIAPAQSSKGEIAAFEIEMSVNSHGILSMKSATIVEEVEVPTYATEVPKTEALKKETINASSAQTESLDKEENVSMPTLKNTKVEAPEVRTDVALNQPTTTQGDPREKSADETINATDSEVDSDAQGADVHSKNKPIETDPKVEFVKKNKRTSVSLSEYLHGGISKKDLQKLMEEERQMALQDKMMEETKDRKNAVETYIYDMRNKINDQYKDFATEADREAFSTRLQEAEEWLYEEGEDATESVYIDKLKDLKVLGDPIEMRYKENSERQLAVNQLYYCICSFRNAVLTNDPRLDHIDVAEKQKVVEASDKAYTWLSQRWQQQCNLPKHADPVLLSMDVTKYTQEFDSYCKRIVLKPKPDSCKTQKSPKEDLKPAHKAEGEQRQVGNGDGNGMKQPPVDKKGEQPNQNMNDENLQQSSESMA